MEYSFNIPPEKTNKSYWSVQGGGSRCGQTFENSFLFSYSVGTFGET